jgi:hypothetical protein
MHVTTTTTGNQPAAATAPATGASQPQPAPAPAPVANQPAAKPARKGRKGRGKPAVVPVALSATPCAAGNASQPKVALGKYAKPAAAFGIGNMGNAGSAMFTLGAWPRSAANPAAPAGNATPARATVPQALWLAARAAGATAAKAVSGLAIGKQVLAPGTPANVALLCSAAAQRVVKGQRYAGGGQACGLWLAGYIGPHKSAACIATGALKVAAGK